MMNRKFQDNLFKTAHQEVIELHMQIENLFRQTKCKEERLPFLSYFHPNFTMISPDGILRNFAWLSKWFHHASGSRPQVKISIENFKNNFCSPDIVIVNYEEYQQITNTESLRRISTAIFLPTNHPKQPLLWSHLHETWVQQEGGYE